MEGKSSMSRCSLHNDYGRTSSHSVPRYSTNAGNYMQPETINKVQKKYSVVTDNYQTLNQVPGKSVQECFDRVNGSLETPPQPQPHSRSKKTYPSPISNFNLSGSKPVQHSLPVVKKLSSWKKSLIAQKILRKLLIKHSTNDQNHEAAHFSVFETSPIQFAMDSPESSSSTITTPCSLQKCSGGSSSTHKKMPSRFKTLSQVSCPSAGSPEVLKRIKNMALHEKYIDQLLIR